MLQQRADRILRELRGIIVDDADCLFYRSYRVFRVFSIYILRSPQLITNRFPYRFRPILPVLYPLVVVETDYASILLRYQQRQEGFLRVFPCVLMAWSMAHRQSGKILIEQVDVVIEAVVGATEGRQPSLYLTTMTLPHLLTHRLEDRRKGMTCEEPCTAILLAKRLCDHVLLIQTFALKYVQSSDKLLFPNLHTCLTLTEKVGGGEGRERKHVVVGIDELIGKSWDAMQEHLDARRRKAWQPLGGDELPMIYHMYFRVAVHPRLPLALSGQQDMDGAHPRHKPQHAPYQ